MSACLTFGSVAVILASAVCGVLFVVFVLAVASAVRDLDQ